MIEPRDEPAAASGEAPAGGTLAPLPGERGIPDVAERSRQPVSRKGLAALVLFVLSLGALTAFYIDRAFASKKTDSTESKRASDRPWSASTEPKTLDMTAPAVLRASAPATGTRIPALVPTAEELADPIAVKRTGTPAPATTAGKPVAPEDAPAMLVSARPSAQAAAASRDDSTSTAAGDALLQTRRNLETYQLQLQSLLETLAQTKGAPPAGPLLTVGAAPPSAPSPAGLFGGQLASSATPRVGATLLGHRSLVLPKGTTFTCALKTKVVSAASGFVACQVQRNVYSEDGRVLLIERGSHLDGEYRITAVRPGTVRIPVLWMRVRTPNAVVVDIDSPGTGPLGESGIDGNVDNRWGERIGAAMLLSLIDDAVKIAIAHESSSTGSDTVVLPSTTGNTSKLAEKVLDSTINIPPLIYQNHGGIVGIYVARDVDFSAVYELRPQTR